MTATAAVPAAPFRGLAPYGDGDADGHTFFGRERETEIVVANLLASRLTVLYGPSGVGKTSLLRAGVARRVRELAARGGARGPDGAAVVFATWSGDAVRDLEAAVAGEVLAASGRTDAPDPPPGASLADALDHWSAVLDGDLYLVLDQLEELFVYHGADLAPGTLLRELPEVIARPGLRTHVLLSLRDDALAQLDVLKGPVPGLFANTVRLDRLDRADAQAVILGCVQAWDDAASPADRMAVEPALVDRVLDETAAADGRIEAPYLQLVMERLWAEELTQGSRALRASTLEALGGSTRIVRAHLGRALAGLAEGEQEIAARMFEHLVTPSGTKIGQRSVDLAQFARAPQDEVDSALGHLTRERILRPLDEGSGGTRYEIFHDVLAEAIIGWGRRRDLERARRAAQTHKRRLAVVAITSLVALIAMTAVTVFALTQRHTARVQQRSAQARALAATALTQLGRDPELSLLLARRAAGLSDSSLVEDVLRKSLLESRVRRVVPLGAAGTAAVFRSDGTTVAAVTAVGRVVVVDSRSGRVLRSFPTGSRRLLVDAAGDRVVAFGLHHRPALFAIPSGASIPLRARPVTEAVFSRDGHVLVTMDTGRLVHVWDTRTGRSIATFETERPTRIAAVAPDDTRVAVADGTHGRVVDVFSIAGGSRLAELPEAAGVTHLVYDDTGRYLAAALADRTVTLHDARTGVRLRSYAGHVGAITSVAFSPDATLLATSSTDGTARVSDTRDGLVSQLTGHGLGVTSIVFSPDGGRAATASTDGTARIWNVRNGQPVAVLAGHGAAVTSVAFSADGRSLVTAGDDGTTRIWSAQAEPSLVVVRRERAAVPAARPTVAGIAVAPPGSSDLTASPDGTLFAVASRRSVVVERARTGTTVATVTPPSPATGVALAPGDDALAVTGRDGRVRVYGLDGTLRRTLGGGPALTRPAFSPDGTTLAAGSTDHTVHLWNLSTGRDRVLRGHTDVVESARFSPDGSELVTASADHFARVWDVATGRTTLVLRGAFARVSDASFSPDGRWIVTAGPGKAGLFDARSGALLFYLQGHRGPLTSASFAADGRTIVTSGADGTVRTYRCDVCVGLPGLERLADERLAATHRRLSARERRDYLP